MIYSVSYGAYSHATHANGLNLANDSVTEPHLELIFLCVCIECLLEQVVIVARAAAQDVVYTCATNEHACLGYLKDLKTCALRLYGRAALRMLPSSGVPARIALTSCSSCFSSRLSQKTPSSRFDVFASFAGSLRVPVPMPFGPPASDTHSQGSCSESPPAVLLTCASEVQPFIRLVEDQQLRPAGCSQLPA